MDGEHLPTVVREHVVRSAKSEQGTFGGITTRCNHHEASYALLQNEAAGCVPVEAALLLQARDNLFFDNVFDTHLAQHDERGLQTCVLCAWS